VRRNINIGEVCAASEVGEGRGKKSERKKEIGEEGKRGKKKERKKEREIPSVARNDGARGG